MASEALEEFRWNSVILRDKIGAGSFAKVYEAECEHVNYAVKKFRKPRDPTTIRFGEWERECRIWSALRHPNIVTLYGITFEEEDRSKPPLLVMERMEKSLSCHLRDTSPEGPGRASFPFDTKLSILLQVCKALIYLHKRDLVHGDLTSNNVLLNISQPGNVTARLSDFGVSRSLVGPISMSTLGTECYMPPEVSEDPPRLTSKVDVYSVGVLAIHTVTHKCPKRLPATRRTSTGLEAVCEYERFSRALKEFKEDNNVLLPLIEKCLDNDPQARPEANEIVEELGEMKNKMPNSQMQVVPSKPAEETYSSTHSMQPVYSVTHNVTSNISLSGCDIGNSNMQFIGSSFNPPSPHDQAQIDHEPSRLIPLGKRKRSVLDGATIEGGSTTMEGAVIPMEGVSTGQEGTTLGPIRGTTPTAENKPTEGPTPTAETMSVEGTTPTAESHTRATQSEKSHQEPSSLREKEENKTSSKNEKNPKKFAAIKWNSIWFKQVKYNPYQKELRSYVPGFADNIIMVYTKPCNVVQLDGSLYFYSIYGSRINKMCRGGRMVKIDNKLIAGNISVAATTSSLCLHVIGTNYNLGKRHLVIHTLDPSQSSDQYYYSRLPEQIDYNYTVSFCIGSCLLIVARGMGEFKGQVRLLNLDQNASNQGWSMLSQCPVSSGADFHNNRQLLQYRDNLLYVSGREVVMVPMATVMGALSTKVDISSELWVSLQNLPVDEGKLIVFREQLLSVGGLSLTSSWGGYLSRGASQCVTGNVYVYCHDSAEWIEVACLNQPRFCPALFVANDKLFVVGGQVVSEEERAHSVSERWPVDEVSEDNPHMEEDYLASLGALQDPQDVIIQDPQGLVQLPEPEVDDL